MSSQRLLQAIRAIFLNWNGKIKQTENRRQTDNTSIAGQGPAPTAAVNRVHQMALPAFGPVVPAPSLAAPAPSNMLQPGPHVPTQPLSSAPPSPRCYPSGLPAPPVSPQLPTITNMLSQLDRPAVDSAAPTGHRASPLKPFTSQFPASRELPPPNPTNRGNHILDQPLRAPVRFPIQTQRHFFQPNAAAPTRASNTTSQQPTSQQQSFALPHRPGQSQASQQHPPTSSGAQQRNP